MGLTNACGVQETGEATFLKETAQVEALDPFRRPAVLAEHLKNLLLLPPVHGVGEEVASVDFIRSLPALHPPA
ncbi:hypothetical protein ABTH79_19580, partial [Acinetobacter baumannii]